jgi:hypothetical protein
MNIYKIWRFVILTSFGIKDSRMEEAVSAVFAKQDAMGRWKMENTYALLVPITEELV